MSKPASYSYKFDRFRLSIVDKTLHEDGVIGLSDTQFKTLLKLIENKGEGVDKKKLAREVGTPTSGPGFIETAIKDLRIKLRDPKEEGRFIRTGSGTYSFVADVIKVQDVDLGGSREPEPYSAQPEDEIASPDDLIDGTISLRELWRGSGKIVKWVLSLGVILTAAISISQLIGPDYKSASSYASRAQVLVLLAALAGSMSKAKEFRQLLEDAEVADQSNQPISAIVYDDPEARKIAKDAQEMSTKYWRGILFTWVIFYGVLTFLLIPGIEEDVRALKTLSIASDLFNNLNTLLVILCYDVLNRPTEIRKGRASIGDSRFFIGLGFVIAFLVLEILSVRPHIHEEITETKYVLTEWGLFSGVIGGIAVALLIGRLQSAFLGPPRWLIILLYFYIAIQPLYVHFAQRNSAEEIRIAVALINAALILKCLLYLYIAFLLKSGRLLFYLVLVRRTHQKIGREWQNFQALLDGEN
jgi:DNA-binding winged helix-turn-helix (wHTH) protein